MDRHDLFSLFILTINKQPRGNIMFKKYAALALMCGFLYLPQAQAASAVEYAILLAIYSIFPEPVEDAAVTDTALRSVCVHALNGNYYSFDGDEPLVEGGAPLGYDLHLCISTDVGMSPAFDKICTNKLKYDAASFVDQEQGVGFFTCSEPVV